MHRRLAAVSRLQGSDDGFDVLDLVAVGDQHRVRGLDHHQIINPQRGDQARFTAYIAVAGILGQDVPLDHIAVPVCLTDFAQGRPGTDVTPAAVQGHNSAPVGVLHHRVVDAVRG